MYYAHGKAVFFTGDYFPTVYADQLRAVRFLGVTREARGTTSRELRPTTAVIRDVSGRFMVIPGRGLNHCFAMAEAIAILCPHNSVDFLTFYNSGVAHFSNDKKTFDGHYGTRLAYYNQLEFVIDELKRDPGSRRAMCTIWNPSKDTVPGSKDYPCNVMAMFKIDGDEQVSCHVIRRSSDLFWGVPYDHVVFTIIQAVVAASLGKRPGSMVETADSLHLYSNLYEEQLQRTLQAIGEKRIWALTNSHPQCDLNSARQHSATIIQAHEELLKNPPTMFAVARKYQLQIPDVWFADTWMCLACYHLWKTKRFTSFLRALNHVSISFRSALFSTFETRVQSRRKELGENFIKEFNSLCGSNI